MNNEEISLHVITLLAFPLITQSENKNDFLNNWGLNPTDKTELTAIEEKCKEIGKCGWAIPVRLPIKIDEGARIIDDWFGLVSDGKCSKIDQYFLDKEKSFSKECFGVINTYLIETDNYFQYSSWNEEARRNYTDGRYLSCCYILTAMLEGLIRQCPISENRMKLKRYFEESAKKEMHSIDISDREDMFAFMIEKYYLLPSLEGFIEHTYSMNSKEQFGVDGNIEPSALKRDWLMHGMTTKTVGKKECLQLLNAITSFASMRNDMATY